MMLRYARVTLFLRLFFHYASFLRRYHAATLFHFSLAIISLPFRYRA